MKGYDKKMNKYFFKRFELKYILTNEQYKKILLGVKEHLKPDQYGETTIQSLYYDTDSFLLIRNSIEKPPYKEKIRVRSYGLATEDSIVFLELKKKYQKVVYKRRIEIKEKDLNGFILEGKNSNGSQIEKEIIYFCNFYKDLKPKMLMLYDRSAFYSEDKGLRITFDKNVRYRVDDLNLCTNLNGKALLDENKILMEIKTGNGFPRWLLDLLNENHAYKTRFSKYGKAYQLELMKKRKEKKTEEKIYV